MAMHMKRTVSNSTTTTCINPATSKVVRPLSLPILLLPTSRVTAIPKEKIDVPKKIRKIRSGREVGDGSLVRAPVEKRKAAVV